MADDEQVNILLVDDQPSKLLTYEAILKDLDATLVKASSAREALDYLLRNDVAVILVDVFMPDLDGFQLASMIREHPRFEKTAIIFISAVYQSEMDRLRGYESGAVDYVPVPVVPEILKAKVRIFLDLYRKTRALQRLNRDLEDLVAERAAELKASNLRLQESEERLRLASEAAEFGTYDCNPRTGMIHCSPQMRLLLGHEGDGELGLEAFLAHVHEEDRPAVRRSLLGLERSGDDRHRVEFRVMKAGGVGWLLDCGRAYFGEDGGEPVRVMGTVLDLTERKRVEERQSLLMAELDHRVKNILSNVGAIAKLSSKNTTSVGDFVKALDARIHAISKAHSLLRRDKWEGVDLKSYFAELLGPFISGQGKNITFEGEAVSLSPAAAQSFALVFHELATNAVKYGALSVPEGKVTLSWKRVAGRDGFIRLDWKERGGPKPERQGTGFGSMVIATIMNEFGSGASYEFAEDGVSFGIEVEIERGESMKAEPQASESPALPAGSPFHRSLRILLVEDEVLIALQTKAELEAAGHEVVALAVNMAQAMEHAEALDFDFALLDLRLGNDLTVPVAAKLNARGLPFAFVTGFGDDGILPAHLRSVRRFTKPYEIAAILSALAHHSARVDRGGQADRPRAVAR